ncbi:hypothetical protein [Sorangium sp. So ce117]|uniref:hypothetical protein n=1 Tax=Sorangium sp. So ce117 TaxID=3133277 RepID=UPI003F61FD9C
MSANHATTTSTFRYLTCVSAALLAGGLSLGCIADGGIHTEEELGEAADELTGWYYYWKGTTTDPEPHDMGPSTDRTCVLRGVAGNLSRGTSATADTMSAAAIGATVNSFLGYSLFGHGGAHLDSNDQPIWYNNPVIAHATCFKTTLNRTLAESWWGGHSGSQPDGPPPWKVADLDPANRRQCYLYALWSVNGAWNSAESYVTVAKVTTTSSRFPTTGWYLYGDLTATPGAGAALTNAVCVDFPEGTVFTSGFVSADPGETKTVTITSGPGIKGCALRTLVGAFNQNSWTDGAVINQPSTIDGNWTITVTNGKSARWACAE